MSDNSQPTAASPVSASGYPVPPAPHVPSNAPGGPGGGYVQTAPGAPPVYVPPTANAPVPPPAPTPFPAPAATPVATPGSALGTVALIVAILAVVVSSILSATTGFAAAQGAISHAGINSPGGLESLSDEQALALLSPVRGLVLWAEIGFWAGTVLGLWALIQGIVAIATRRGRGRGIAATIVAAAGPIVYGVAVTIAVIVGIAVAAPTYY